MKKLYFTLLAILGIGIQSSAAANKIGLTFSRTGTDAGSVTINVTDAEGAPIEGAKATIVSSHEFKPNGGNAINETILCPNVNGNTDPTIELTVSISGVPTGFTFNSIGLDIHALNGGSNYQENSDGVTRRWNVAIEQGASAEALSEFGLLDDIDIAAGVGESGNVHKVWTVESDAAVEAGTTIVVKMTITKGSANAGCFFGLSSIELSTNSATPDPEPEPEPEPTPEPDDSEGKIYYIQWKNTGTNYITENADGYMTVEAADVTKAQFWMFIPTDKENCFYIKNTATGNYIGSCNKTPSSASRITTTDTPTEYYVAKTSATSGEIAGCHYFSSTDCASYDKENAGPRALNKDGASTYVITWQAGTSRVGSYWKLVETEDLYEIRPFDASTTIGSIGTSYNIEGMSGKNITLAEGTPAMSSADQFDNNQEWYFVGTNNSSGWQIASAAKPATVVGIIKGAVTAAEGIDTRWKVQASKENEGYFFFTSGDDTLSIDGESLFRFNRLRSLYARNNQIYNNPCGRTGANYLTQLNVTGEDTPDNLVYKTSAKPSTWHLLYSGDKAAVAIGKNFEVSATLKNNAAASLTANCYFDWNCDGIFETTEAMSIGGKELTATIGVPEWAAQKQSRMRVRINSNGLDLAEDDVEGFVYDFTISAVEAQDERTASVSVNDKKRGTATLSTVADSYARGTELTATAEAIGNAKFICWRQEGVIVSTDAEYTFTLDHNVALKAYFSPNTDETSLGVSTPLTSETVSVEQVGHSIVATSSATIEQIALYTPDAALVAKSKGNTIAIDNTREGIYIVNITTDKGYKNCKIYIKK